jgi:hypothetical protein
MHFVGRDLIQRLQESTAESPGSDLGDSVGLVEPIGMVRLDNQAYRGAPPRAPAEEVITVASG